MMWCAATPQKFIQSVTQGHPGARDAKHMAHTDAAITDPLFGKGWLRSTCYWEVSNDALGRRKQVLYGL